MNKPCEYCGHDLPAGVDLGTRRVRSYHFERCEVRLAAKEDSPQTKQEWLDDFIRRAGFRYGWASLESWARRMAEQAYEEREQ